jgi:hypothetical protein
MKRPIVGRLIDEAPRFDAAWRREVARQIYLPLAVGSIVLLVALVVLLGARGGEASLWADLAIIYLSAAAGVVGVILLALLAALVYGVSWLVGRIPEPARRVRAAAGRVRLEARRGADALAQPAIRGRAVFEALRSIRGAVGRALRRW